MKEENSLNLKTQNSQRKETFVVSNRKAAVILIDEGSDDNNRSR
jgi:hypothetical protein